MRITSNLCLFESIKRELYSNSIPPGISYLDISFIYSPNVDRNLLLELRKVVNHFISYIYLRTFVEVRLAYLQNYLISIIRERERERDYIG